MNKARYWTFIGYPESMPSDWCDLITATHEDVICSPLHDKDVNPSGELKKPHFHFMFIAQSTTTSSRPQELSNMLSGVLVQKCFNPFNMFEYLTHKNNPEKASYNSSDILYFGHANADMFQRSLSDYDKVKVYREIIDVIYKYDITSYYEFLYMCPEDIFLFCCEHSNFCNTLIRSKPFVNDCYSDFELRKELKNES